MLCSWVRGTGDMRVVSVSGLGSSGSSGSGQAISIQSYVSNCAKVTERIRIPLAVVVVRSGNATQVAAPGANYEGISLGLRSKEVRRVRTRTWITRVEIPD